MFQHKRYPYLTVSPDGIAQINVGGEIHTACVEMKTRVADTSQQLAIAAATQHGRIVECIYGDLVFLSCVPAKHRSELLHHACVCDVQMVVYVVSILDEQNGRKLLQIVICKVEKMHIVRHLEKLVHLGQHLMGWLYDPSVIDRGYLINEDFPTWVTLVDRETLTSRSYMWCAMYKKIKRVDRITPCKPIHLFKAKTQYIYNKGKGGLDKSTEN